MRGFLALVLVLLTAPAGAFVTTPRQALPLAPPLRAKGLSIGDISGGGGKPAPPPPPPPKGVTAKRERVERAVPALSPPSLPSFSAPSLPSFSAPSLPSFGKPAPAPAPPPPKARLRLPKAPKVGLPKAPKVGLPKGPEKPKGSTVSLNAKGRILVDGAKYQSNFGSLVDRKVMYNPLKIRDGVAAIPPPKYVQEMAQKGGKKSGGSDANPLAALGPVLKIAPLFAAIAAVGVVGTSVLGTVDVNDGTVDIVVPSDPVALASKAAAGQPIKARLSGLPLLPPQIISINVAVSVAPASADEAADIAIDARGGIGAGLKALGGAVKANVNGVPVDANVGLTKGAAAISVKAPVIPAVDFPLKSK